MSRTQAPFGAQPQKRRHRGSETKFEGATPFHGFFLAFGVLLYVAANVSANVPLSIGTAVCSVGPYNEIAQRLDNPTPHNSERYGYSQMALRGTVAAVTDARQRAGSSDGPRRVFIYTQDVLTGAFGNLPSQELLVPLAVTGCSDDDDDNFNNNEASLKGVDLSDDWLVAYNEANIFFYSYNPAAAASSMFGAISLDLPQIDCPYTWVQTYCEKTFVARQNGGDTSLHYQYDSGAGTWGLFPGQDELVPARRLLVNERHRELVVLGVPSGGSLQPVTIYEITSCCGSLVIRQTFELPTESEDVTADSDGNLTFGAPDSGVVMIYERTGAGFYGPLPTQIIPGPFSFGSCVAHSKDDGSLLVGANDEAVSGSSWVGRAHTYRDTAGPGTYSLFSSYDTPVRDRNGFAFGDRCVADRSIDAHTDIVLLSHPNYRDGSLRGGAVFIFYMVDPGTAGVEHRCSTNADYCTSSVYSCPAGTCGGASVSLLAADDDDDSYALCAPETCDARLGLRSDTAVLDGTSCPTDGPVLGCTGICECGSCGPPTTCPSATPTVSTSNTPSNTRTPSTSRSSTVSLSRTPSSSSSMTGTPTASMSPSVTPSTTASETPTPTVSDSSTTTSSITATPTVSDSATSTVSITATPTVSNSATSTVSITATPTVSDSNTATVTPTSSVTPTSTVSLSSTPSSTNTATATETPSQTGTQTPTQTPSTTTSMSSTPSTTNTGTTTATPTRTPSQTPTSSTSQSNTPSTSQSNTPSTSQSNTPTGTSTGTPSPTVSDSSSVTPSTTSSATPSISQSSSETPTNTPSASASISPLASQSNTPTSTSTPSTTASVSPTPSTTSTASLSTTNTASSTPTPTSSATPTISETATISETPSSTVSLSATATVTPSPTISDSNTQTPSVSESATPTPSSTASLSTTPSTTTTATATSTSTSTPTQTPTSTMSLSSTPSTTNTGTASATSTPTISDSSTSTTTPSSSSSATATSSNSPSATTTPSETPSNSRTPSETRSATPTSSESFSGTPSRSPSFSGTRTSSESFTSTPTPSESRSATPSRSASPSSSATPSESRSVTPSATASASGSTPLCVTDADCPSTGDLCLEAICLGPTLGCGTRNDTREDNACVHDFPNACEWNPRCRSGLCAYTESVFCPDQGPCYDGYCDVVGGGCLQNATAADGRDCDPSACAIFDACYAPGDGLCAAGKCAIKPSANATSCDDGYACTNDRCLGVLGCISSPEHSLCAGLHPDAAGACITFMCSPGSIFADPLTGCVQQALADGAECDHDMSCVEEAECQSALCVAIDPITTGECENLNDCNPSLCDPTSPSADSETGCVPTVAVDGSSCSETDNACQDGGGVCISGECTTSLATEFYECSSYDDCLEDTCHPVFGCITSLAPTGTPCFQRTSHGCYLGEGECMADECVGTTTGATLDCDDLIECTEDRCARTANGTVVCENIPRNGYCLAEEAAACTKLLCTGTTPGSSGCEPVPSDEGMLCGDPRAGSCAAPGVCTSGCCIAEADESLCPLDPLLPCAIPSCSAGYNSCDLAPIDSLCGLDLATNAGDSCYRAQGPGDFCSGTPICTAGGLCEFTTTITDADCQAATSALFSCVTSVCDPNSGCTSELEAPGTSCNSVYYAANSLTPACAPAGVCIGGVGCHFSDTEPVNCPSAPSECEVPSCGYAGECIFTPDAHECEIIYGPATPADCRTWSCDPGVGCVMESFREGLVCTDGSPCTVEDVCVAGECHGEGRDERCDQSDTCDPEVCQTGVIAGLGSFGVCATSNATRAALNGEPCGNTDTDLCNFNKQCSNGACLASLTITDADCDALVLANGGGALHPDCSYNVCVPYYGCLSKPSNPTTACTKSTELGAPIGDVCFLTDACDWTGHCEPDPSNPTGICEDGFTCTYDVCVPEIGCERVYIKEYCPLIHHDCAEALCYATGNSTSGCDVGPPGAFDGLDCEPRQAGTYGGTCAGYFCIPYVADHLCPQPAEGTCKVAKSLADDRAQETLDMLALYSGDASLLDLPYLTAADVCIFVDAPDGGNCTVRPLGCDYDLSGICAAGDCIPDAAQVLDCAQNALPGPPGAPGEDGLAVVGPPGPQGLQGDSGAIVQVFYYEDDDDDDDDWCEARFCAEVWVFPAAAVSLFGLVGIAAAYYVRSSTARIRLLEQRAARDEMLIRDLEGEADGPLPPPPQLGQSAYSFLS